MEENPQHATVKLLSDTAEAILEIYEIELTPAQKASLVAGLWIEFIATAGTRNQNKETPRGIFVDWNKFTHLFGESE